MSIEPMLAPKDQSGLKCPECKNHARHVTKEHERLGAGHERTAFECGNPHCERFGKEVPIR